jgi:hypothetical protein
VLPVARNHGMAGGTVEGSMRRGAGNRATY